MVIRSELLEQQTQPSPSLFILCKCARTRSRRSSAEFSSCPMENQKHTYRLHYFDVRGRGEPIRLIFEYYGAKYDDHRIKEEEWPSLKGGENGFLCCTG
ncbi:unnamed protein product [Cylicostephanus goldi]|uniref:GST N-terminal domain-containing protein n=1 Tax=Cylicostephanus goldi TaxID=71465 RepID=A0A3P6S9A8_CYLGO|nr:unnamed protein product [Cylicostephanus goldi]